MLISETVLFSIDEGKEKIKKKGRKARHERFEIVRNGNLFICKSAADFYCLGFFRNPLKKCSVCLDSSS